MLENVNTLVTFAVSCGKITMLPVDFTAGRNGEYGYGDSGCNMYSGTGAFCGICGNTFKVSQVSVGQGAGNLR
jgi:hypothetical protein